ncbi:PilZ domain-containing protein [Aurantiacibacter gangjinensis]|uniref:Uncharacterized protein n=1 Tax=Aurantiacibacter gangjinensis TaxID=502682 RepID=A0A0G9MQW2_9SPHN|nr:PilZ domain-containing protein [Aurantiacibacter gangjinensis]APE28849.1 hypothetical protein BMF35_a2020 [Aurantiacibacter gangjinensis]KLE32989.1 hypothetical protein AAW01_02995 [Aurantiacibacter gangjinensis]
MSLGRALMRLREKRQRVEFRAGMIASGACDQIVMVCDVSAKGLGGITTGDAVNAGDRVLFVMPDMLEMTATVRWSIANQFGAQFDEMQDVKRLSAYDMHGAEDTLPRSA